MTEDDPDLPPFLKNTLIGSFSLLALCVAAAFLVNGGGILALLLLKAILQGE